MYSKYVKRILSMYELYWKMFLMHVNRYYELNKTIGQNLSLEKPEHNIM